MALQVRQKAAHLYGKGPGLLGCTRCALPQILHVCQRSSQLIFQIFHLIRYTSAVSVATLKE